MKQRKAAAIILAALMTLAGHTTCHAEEIEIPQNIKRYCEEAGKEYNIAPEIIEALCWMESRCEGDNITQITSTRWYREGIEATQTTNLKNPKQNIMVCAYYLEKYFTWGLEPDPYGEEENDIYLVLDCWHEGPENAVRTYDPTKPSYYARRIVEIAEEIKDAGNG